MDDDSEKSLENEDEPICADSESFEDVSSEDNFSRLQEVYSQFKSEDQPKNIEEEADFIKKNKNELFNRDRVYSDILVAFKNIYKERQLKKEKYKWRFFIMVCLILFVFVLLISVVVFLLIVKIDVDELIDFVPVIITAIASMLSSILIIPTVIAKYLFNPEEDNKITEMILEMQKQDLENKNLFYKDK